MRQRIDMPEMNDGQLPLPASESCRMTLDELLAED
jgi:hypothetical protein